MTKMLHAVIISDDFRVFIHAHPQLEPSGHFLLQRRRFRSPVSTICLRTASRAAPASKCSVSICWRVRSVRRPIHGARDLSERSTTCVVDGYTVTLSSLALKAGGESMLDVHILRAGKPAWICIPTLARWLMQSSSM